jgi:activating signal cointegrator 1
MKAITLTQPWATLVAIGAKRIETRGWQTRYRGPLAIHAGKGLGPVGGKRGFAEVYSSEPFRSALLAAMPGGIRFPFGAIVATCELVECMEIDGAPTGFAVHTPDRSDVWWRTRDEIAFGDYTPGRFAWLLANIQPLPEPAPTKGALGLWEWENGAPHGAIEALRGAEGACRTR